MWELLGQWLFWLPFAVLYMILCFVMWYRDEQKMRARREELEERARRQNREWREQAPLVRILAMELRRRRRENQEIMEQLKNAVKEPKDKPDWKKEGF